MANSMTVTTVPWYLTVPDLRPTLAAPEQRSKTAATYNIVAGAWKIS